MANIEIPPISTGVTEENKFTQPWFRLIEALVSMQVYDGNGSPEGVFDAGFKAWYLDTATQRVYLKTTATGNTGWIAIN